MSGEWRGLLAPCAQVGAGTLKCCGKMKRVPGTARTKIVPKKGRKEKRRKDLKE
jgi:hypothetical protein